METPSELHQKYPEQAAAIISLIAFKENKQALIEALNSGVSLFDYSSPKQLDYAGHLPAKNSVTDSE